MKKPLSTVEQLLHSIIGVLESKTCQLDFYNLLMHNKLKVIPYFE